MKTGGTIVELCHDLNFHIYTYVLTACLLVKLVVEAFPDLGMCGVKVTEVIQGSDGNMVCMM